MPNQRNDHASRADFCPNARYTVVLDQKPTCIMGYCKSIKCRLIALGVLLVIIGILVRLSAALPAVQKPVHDLMAAEQLSIATYVARDVDNRIQARRALIHELAATLPPALLEQPALLTSWLGERERLNPLFNRSLLVLAPDGHPLAEYSAMPGRKRSSYADLDWFAAAMAANRTDLPLIGRPRRDEVDGAPILVVAAPVRDAGNRTRAVLAGIVTLDAKGFLDGLLQSRLGSSGGFLLISPADKLFVGSSDPAMVLQPTPAQGTNPLHDRAMAGYRGTGITVNAKGIEELSAMATVPGTGWFVVARTPTAEVFQPVAELRRIMVRNAFATMTGMILILLVLLPRVLRPLTSAARSIREMAEGKRDLAPLPVTRQDEVGDLVLGFNHLVAKLHEKEQALMQTMQKLDQLAGTDTLTGAWNRRHFDEVVDRELDRSRRYGHALALIVLDLDRFKEINDRYGHVEGDRVLQEVASCMREALRKPDSLTRWGGEEFIVLMPDTGIASAAILAERLRSNIAARHIEGIGTVTASIGVAELGTSEQRNAWLARADAALYRAKQAGRNRVELADAAQGAGLTAHAH